MTTATGSPMPSGAPNTTPAALQARSFFRVLVGLILIVVLLGGGLLWLELRKANQEEQKQTSRQHVILRPKDEQNDWRAKEGSRVEELNRTMENLQRELKQLREAQEKEQKQTPERGQPTPRGRVRADGTPAPPVPPLDQILPAPEAKDAEQQSRLRPGSPQRAGSPSPAERGTPATPGTSPAPPANRPGAAARPSPASSQSDGTPPTPPAPAPGAPGLPVGRPSPDPRGIPGSGVLPETGKLRVITPRVVGGQKGAAASAETVGWLPSGSIIPARILTGADVGTGTGPNLPYPVLVRLTDSAILPNDFRMDITGCFAIGAAIGDLPSERVTIRMENLSCLRRGGGLITIDGDFKGHVIGPDGKLGVRARIVEREGVLIARSLVAGFLSGLSDAFKPRISYAPIQLGGTDVTSNQAFTLPPFHETLAAAGMSGVGKTMELLAKHYLDQAQHLYPVLELPAGLAVDIVVLKGIPLKFRTAKNPGDTGPEVIE